MSETPISRAIVPAATKLPQVFVRRGSAAVIISAVTAAAVLSVSRINRARRAIRPASTTAVQPSKSREAAEPSVAATAPPTQPARLLYRRVTVIEVWQGE